MRERLPTLLHSGTSSSCRGAPLLASSAVKRGSVGSPGEMQLDLSKLKKSSKPAVYTGCIAISPAKKAQNLLKQLLDQLDTDWKNIRSLNLGVKSGTGVVDDLVMHTIQARVKELNMMCITSDEAAQAVGKMAQKLSKQQLQQLQVLFDMTGNEYLSDYMRVMVLNTLEPMAREPVDLVSMPKKGRQKKPNTAPLPSTCTSMKVSHDAATSERRPHREETLRFAGYLPENHPLSQKAYSLYNSRLPNTKDTSADGPLELMSEADAQAKLRDYCGKHGVRSSMHEEFYGAIPKPDEEERAPMYESIHERWKASTCTVVKDEAMCSTIMIGDALPAWAKTPKYKLQYMADQEAKKLKAVQQATGGRLASRGQMLRPSLSGLQPVGPMSASVKPIVGDSESEASTPATPHR